VSATGELELEKRLIAEIKPDTLRSIVTAISREVHVAGTSAQARTRDYVINRWKRAGLSTQVYPYEVYIPHAKSSSLEMQTPIQQVFKLGEVQLPGEDSSMEYPWVNGYSASGTATGAIVYVNYGLHEDYRELDSLGISIKGKIALARYGKSYRGIKAMLAEEYGATGLLIFSDPSQDGYDAGDVFPAGPMRGWNGVQRGSIYNGHGDPTTPGYSSIIGARRVSLDSIPTLPRIPVIPISYGIANELLGRSGGRDVPNSNWQGGLPFRYHIGGESVRVKLNVVSDTGLKPIWNTVAKIEGSTWPDEWVIIGGHRDAWCHGAEDNASGCASVVAAAEAFAKLAKEGIRPKRSILFVTWDAEEWGLLGSTEWVEQLEPELKQKAVAYINQDMCATGSSFGASADPSLREFVYEVSKSLHDPHDSTLYSAWVKSSHAKDGHPEIGLLGGGSDFSPFYNHLGIPSLEHGFGGPFGQYHSNHDNIQWTLRFGDSTFQYHALSSRFAAVEAMRLANADVLPFNFAELGMWLASVLTSSKSHSIGKFHDSLGFASLDSAIADFRSAAADYASLLESKALRGSTLLADEKKLSDINQEIRSVGLAFTKSEGLPTDIWERNMLVISDPQNGYADLTLPAIGIAMRGSDERAVTHEVDDLARHVRAAIAILYRINAELRGR
jgi:N-acetylated-alpha-linked acidic dipeptidase